MSGGFPPTLLPRQERSSQTGNHRKHGRKRKGEVDSDSLFRVFRWIPWLISHPSGAAVGCCWTESAVRICADLGCRDNNRQPLSQVVLPFGPELFNHKRGSPSPTGGAPTEALGRPCGGVGRGDPRRGGKKRDRPCDSGLTSRKRRVDLIPMTRRPRMRGWKSVVASTTASWCWRASFHCRK